MSRTEQLEREAEQTRAQLTGNLEELRASLTPGQVVDQVADYANIGARDFLQNLRDQTVQNPMAALLIGAGVGWMMLGGRRPSSGKGSAGFASGLRQRAHRVGNRLMDAASRAGDNVSRMGRATLDTAQDAVGATSARTSDAGRHLSDAALASYHQGRAAAGTTLGDARSSVGESAERNWAGMRQAAASGAEQMEEATASTTGRIKDAAGGMRETAADARARFTDAAASGVSSIKGNAAAGYKRVSGTISGAAATVGKSAKQLGRGTASAGRKIGDFAVQQPLIVAGLGIAIGACLASMLPMTDTENQVLGEASDSAKDRLGSMAGEGFKKAEKAVDAAADATLVPSARDYRAAAQAQEEHTE